METASQSNPRVHFRMFELDLRTHELFRNGVKLRLRGHPIEVLTILLERPGELVTREALQKRLWPDSTFVDFDQILNQSVAKLRDALGDRAEAPRFIETLPKLGYRFIAPVEQPQPQALGEPEGKTVVSEGEVGFRSTRSRWLRIVAVSFGLCLLSVGLIWWRHQGAPPEDLPPVPLISTGNSCCPTFSPDGTKMAFGWTGEQDANAEAPAGKAHWEIYVMQIGAPGNPIRLTTSPAGVYWGAINPSWSPDDRWIAYLRNRTDGADLMLVPPLGGPERRIADLSGFLDRNHNNPGWTPDGKWVAFPQMDSPLGSSIWAVDVDSGERRRLTTFVARAGEGRYPLGDRSPTFSPDGRSLAFCRKVNDSVYKLYVQPLTRDLRPDGEARLVTDRPYAGFDGPMWTRDGRDIVFSGGVPQFLWRVAASGQEAPRRLSYPAAVLGPAIAGSPPRLVIRVVDREHQFMASRCSHWRAKVPHRLCLFLVRPQHSTAVLA